MVSKVDKAMNILRNKANAAEKDSKSVQGAMVNITHQMQTALGVIISSVELLIEGGQSPEIEEAMLADIKIHALNLSQRVRILLGFVKSENQFYTIDCSRPENIRATILAATNEILPIANEKSVEITLEDFDDIALYHDKKWTADALVGVLENAVKYSPRGSEIKISVERHGINTTINITDEGIGIPEKDRPYIFNKFARGSNVGREEGSGVGLYLVKGIMESQGGNVTVSPGAVKGTTLSLSLKNGSA